MQQTIYQPTDKLWTQSFICACIGNFLLFFAFYLLLPILPLYLMEEFHTSKSLIGIILSCYTIAALLMRPFAGFVLDMFNRKPIYLLSFFLFALCFVGYPLANLVNLFLILRILHGFAFGLITTAGNSLIVDIMPSSRRGEGLGYFGISNTIAMAIGPMTSLFIHDYYTFDSIFHVAIASGFVGFLFAVSIKSSSNTDKVVKQPLAFDRFLLFEGMNAGLCLLLMGVPYGILTTFIAIYGKELGIQSVMGIFFLLMAAGMIISRIFSGRMIDNGRLVQAIAYGTFFCAITFFALAGLKLINVQYNSLILTLFYAISLLLGVGYGMLFPAYNTLFVNLAPNNRRATASSTYMTSWDIGIGIGLVAGGWLADSKGGLPLSYIVGALAVCISLIYFVKVAGPHFEKYKLR
ncbi:MAG TPA: MFS transporter [Paludibacter sp.]